MKHHWCVSTSVASSLLFCAAFKSYRKKNGVKNQILFILYGFLSYTHWDSSYHLYLSITTWITCLSILFWESLRLLNVQFCLSGVVVWDVSYKSQGLEYLVASWKNCLGRLGRFDLLEEVSQWGRLKVLIAFYHPLSLCVSCMWTGMWALSNCSSSWPVCCHVPHHGGDRVLSLGIVGAKSAFPSITFLVMVFYYSSRKTSKVFSFLH